MLEKALRACDDSDPEETHVIDEISDDQNDKGNLLYQYCFYSLFAFDN